MTKMTEYKKMMKKISQGDVTADAHLRGLKIAYWEAEGVPAKSALQAFKYWADENPGMEVGR